MAMNKTTHAIAAVLDTILVPASSVTRPAALYLALHTGDPGADGTANELSVGNGYGRKLITFDGSAVPYVSELDALYGPCTTLAWGNCTHASIWDAETGGNAWYEGPLTTARYIDVDDQLRIPAGDVQVSEN